MSQIHVCFSLITDSLQIHLHRGVTAIGTVENSFVKVIMTIDVRRFEMFILRFGTVSERFELQRGRSSL